MPFGTTAKSRAAGTGRGCRAVVAAGMLEPGERVDGVSRAADRELHLDALPRRRREHPGGARLASPVSTRDAIAAQLDDADVVEEYERQRAEARSAAGTPAEAQDKTATSDGLVRFTAPSIVFRRGEDTAVAGGWQPLLAYDTLLANFAPALERMPPPESPEPLLEFFPDGLTTAEVALLLAEGSDPVPDVEGAERQLLDLVESGVAERLPLGRDALWRTMPTPT